MGHSRHLSQFDSIICVTFSPEKVYFLLKWDVASHMDGWRKWHLAIHPSIIMNSKPSTFSSPGSTHANLPPITFSGPLVKAILLYMRNKCEFGEKVALEHDSHFGMESAAFSTFTPFEICMRAPNKFWRLVLAAFHF